jgi:glycosyltransferase involved in cell wall biosynthesis
VIPCRDAAAYLGATLDSVLAQSLPATEVLVVDDGSADASVQIAHAAGPRVQVVTNPGRGVSAARQYGSTLARGECVQYVDADDLLLPHALATRVEALTATGADVAISDWQRLVGHDAQWSEGAVESGRLPDHVPADVSVVNGFWAPLVAILYRRSAWERVGRWHPTLPIVQDARFLFDAARSGCRFVHVPGVGAQYRQHTSGSVSSAGESRFWADVLQNTLEIETLWAAERLDDARRGALANVYAHCAWVGFAEADEALYQRALAELDRFPHFRPRRALRGARLLRTWTTPATARRLLGGARSARRRFAGAVRRP